MGWLIDGGVQLGSRPGLEWEEGRMWTPGEYIPDDVGGAGASAMVCSPYTKYVFIKPRDGGQYDVQEFTAWRDDLSSYTDTAINAVGGYVFWLGDSSSCGGTEIALNTSDPMQAFLLDDDTKTAFSIARIARGGFFLLGDRQSAAFAATEIKKMTLAMNLDFIVLAVHHTPGEPAADMSLTAVRHLIASIRWDVGPRKPIILMMGARGDIVGADNDNIHIMSEQVRGNMFVGDITDQTTVENQVAMVDRAGYLSLNWWPMVAFVPNSENGDDVRNAMAYMDNRLFHPLLIPKSGSGCPFNTTRDLTASELSDAQDAFKTADLFPLEDTKVRTTSAWFWDFDSVKYSGYVRSWRVPRGNLDGAVEHLDFMSDMQVVFDSQPSWVGHPVFDMDFAMQFSMERRSMSTSVLWERDSSGPGNVPDLHGAKDEREGWITVVTPFELSPTATRFYESEGTVDTVPIIPKWAKFLWSRPISEEEASDPGGGWLPFLPINVPSPGDVISGLLELLVDALIWIPNRLGIAVSPEGATRWSAGLNQPHVVMHGTPQYPDDDRDISGNVTKLNLESAPFAVQLQTMNFKMNGDLGFVWPARVFTIAPIAIDSIIQNFDPVLAPSGVTGWHDIWMDAIGGAGTTPLQFEMGTVPVNEILGEFDTGLSRRIVPAKILYPLLDHKGDFPPMLGRDDREGPTRRDFTNHLARIDITHPHVRRMHEICIGQGCGGGGGGGGTDVGVAGAIKNWPLNEDSQLYMGQGYRGREWDYVCVEHRSLDLNHTAGDQHGVTQILAVAAGEVTFTGRDAVNGPNVIITHPIPPLPSLSTFTSRYAHLAQILVEKGESISAGHQIGTMGQEGAGDALHLHFQLRRGPGCKDGQDTIDPCPVMPVPRNGITPDGCYRDPIVTDPDADIKTTICTTVERALAEAGSTPWFTDEDNNRLRKSTIAVAIAYAESRWNTNDQNCIPDVWYGGTYLSHVGLFQIQNPTQIPNDIIKGIISESSVITNDPGIPGETCSDGVPMATALRGVRIAQDYKTTISSILAFLRMSAIGDSPVENLQPWHPYNICFTAAGGPNCYLEYIALSECPPDTWAQP